MNPWLPYVTKIKLKENRLKCFKRAWYMGKGYDFFYREKGRVMHIAMYVKSMKRLPTQDVTYSIVQCYLKERHDLSEVPLGHR